MPSTLPHGLLCSSKIPINATVDTKWPFIKVLWMSYFNERKSGELLDGFQFTTATLEARNLGN